MRIHIRIHDHCPSAQTLYFFHIQSFFYDHLFFDGKIRIRIDRYRDLISDIDPQPLRCCIGNNDLIFLQIISLGRKSFQHRMRCIRQYGNAPLFILSQLHRRQRTVDKIRILHTFDRTDIPVIMIIIIQRDIDKHIAIILSRFQITAQRFSQAADQKRQCQ